MLAACKRGDVPERERYLTDRSFRRQALEASLVNHHNTYSQQRLSSYALPSGGWDALPEWNPKVRGAPLWDGQTPKTDAEWVSLGKKVFFDYPLRSEPLVEYAAKKPELSAEVGLQRDARGDSPGVVAFVDVDGRERLGITCALCHSQVLGGEVVAGLARRQFDYGKLRLAFHAETQTRVDARLAKRMKTWGPGRADVTEDDDEDPVAIPDLWGLKAQSALTQAGTIRHASPTALAIRQETQLLHSNHERVRPPRVLAWALAMYLYSLTPPARVVVASAEVEKGAALFRRECAECHSNAAYGGEPLDAEAVGTDLSLAKGKARGTGSYRPPALVRVAEAGPYLHHGAVPTLEDLFDPERLQASYSRSPLGPGAVPGHEFGTELPAEDRAALVAWLKTL